RSRSAPSFSGCPTPPKSVLKPLRRQPEVEKPVEPGSQRSVMLRPALMVKLGRLRARPVEPFLPEFEPGLHHRRGELGVKLDAIGGRAVTHRLNREIRSFGQQNCAIGQIETLLVPLIDILRIVEEAAARR